MEGGRRDGGRERRCYSNRGRVLKENLLAVLQPYNTLPKECLLFRMYEIGSPTPHGYRQSSGE